MENTEFYDIDGQPCSPSRAAVVEELRQMVARGEARDVHHAESIRLDRSNAQLRLEHDQRVARRRQYEPELDDEESLAEMERERAEMDALIMDNLIATADREREEWQAALRPCAICREIIDTRRGDICEDCEDRLEGCDLCGDDARTTFCPPCGMDYCRRCAPVHQAAHDDIHD